LGILTKLERAAIAGARLRGKLFIGAALPVTVVLIAGAILIAVIAAHAL